jgi:preprotein translocase subunit SecF
LHNVVNAGVSTTATPVRYNNVTGGNFGDNYLNTSTARTLVTSVTTLSCVMPNSWNGGGTHFSTALANTYGGC